MMNPIESERNGTHDVLAPGSNERIAELEAEKARLQSELQKLQEDYDRDVALLNVYALQRLPKTEGELLRLAMEGPTFKELLNELIPDVVQEVNS